MDKVIINNLKVYGILGIHPHEQRTPQEIRVSLKASTDIKQAADEDDILQAINYSTLAKDITRFIDSSHFYTIEALIEALSAEILQNDRIHTLWLRIEKPNAVPEAESVGVEITRSK